MTKKFRIWDKLAKIFVSNENAAENCNGIFSILPSGEIIENYCGSMLKKDLSNFEIQQWTGLTDSKGVEIYEGDILKWGEKNLSKVEFYNGAFFVFGINWGACWQLADYADAYNIVGNIFQNPELLEKC